LLPNDNCYGECKLRGVRELRVLINKYYINDERKSSITMSLLLT